MYKYIILLKSEGKKRKSNKRLFYSLGIAGNIIDS